jgi:hypothetical protein
MCARVRGVMLRTLSGLRRAVESGRTLARGTFLLCFVSDHCKALSGAYAEGLVLFGPVERQLEHDHGDAAE